ncbi:MAG TPA: BREX system ATP-binding domain-containing protein, partial [Chloroflexota bacterium]
REAAFSAGYLVSTVELNVDQTPFHHFERVFFDIVRNLSSPEQYATGRSQVAPLGEILERDLIPNIAAAKARLFADNGIDVDFRRLVAAYWDTFLPDAGDELALEDARARILQWFTGEGASGYRAFGVQKGVDRGNARLMLQSLCRFACHVGYRGLVVLLDEAEMAYSVMRRADLKQAHNNLLHLINSIDESEGAFLIYAATPDFFVDDRYGIVNYGALAQRIGRPELRVPNALDRVWNLDALKASADDYVSAASKIREIYLLADADAVDRVMPDAALQCYIAELVAMHPEFSHISTWRVVVTGTVQALDRGESGEREQPGAGSLRRRDGAAPSRGMNPDAAAAMQMVEQLRYGIPPHGYSRLFTVGRHEQLLTLERQLHDAAGTALLLQADYGAGKSHLLQVLRELALDAGFAVSLVVVNAQEGVRFDRIDTIFGATCRNLEVDGSGERGIGTLFGLMGAPHLPPLFPHSLSSNGRWDYSEYLESPAMYVALRAWLFGDTAIRLLVEDWLTNPSVYRERGRRLYDALVYGLRDRFQDPRPEWKFHAQKLLVLHGLGQSQCWSALSDLVTIARAAGRRGLVLLFDEVEDMVCNLPRVAQRQEAVRHLLCFFGSQLPVHAFFAVTADFVEQCRPYLPAAASTDAPPLRLPVLPVAPLTREALLELAARIRQVHALAYGWDATSALSDDDLAAVVTRAWAAAPA